MTLRDALDTSRRTTSSSLMVRRKLALSSLAASRSARTISLPWALRRHSTNACLETSTTCTTAHGPSSVSPSPSSPSPVVQTTLPNSLLTVRLSELLLCKRPLSLRCQMDNPRWSRRRCLSLSIALMCLSASTPTDRFKSLLLVPLVPLVSASR